MSTYVDDVLAELSQRIEAERDELTLWPPLAYLENSAARRVPPACTSTATRSCVASPVRKRCYLVGSPTIRSKSRQRSRCYGCAARRRLRFSGWPRGGSCIPVSVCSTQ